MSDEESPFAYLDEAAIAAAPVNAEPYEWTFIPKAIPTYYVDEVLSDAPHIPDRGNYGLPNLKYGSRFDGVVKELLSARFRALVEKKFNLDLRNNPPVLLMMGNTTGQYNEGYAHPDSRHKVVTVILGLTREWPFERGRMRILNGPDREDYAFEYTPEFGSMLMFKSSDKSWHGFLPQKGPRMSLHLCYCDSESYVQSEYRRHRLSAFVKAIPLVGKIVGLMPRKKPGARR
ncbi:MAG: 2OG-Fe(II) oxygenase [Alphaproteobacteria bacterium]|nr:2OG-Fe(II) oxygenase [Alphaproteobacteria bacterium]